MDPPADAARATARSRGLFAIWLRVLWRVRRRRAGRYAWVPFVLGGLAACVFFAGTTAAVEEAQRTGAGIGRPITFLSSALLGLLLIALLRDTGSALGYLFLSRDSAFLLAAPAGTRTIVFTRMLEAIVDGLSFPLVIVLPVLFAVGIASHAPPLYFAGCVAAVLAILSCSAGTGFTIAMVLAPLVPAGRVRVALRVVGALVYFGLWAVVLWSTAGESGTGQPLGARVLSRATLTALPSTWATHALESLRMGGNGAPYGAWLLALAVVSLATPMLLSPRYAAAWQRARETVARERSRVHRSRDRAKAWIPSSTGPRPPSMALAWAMLRRDAHLLARDSGQIWQIVTQVLFSAALPFFLAPHTEAGIRGASLAAATLLALQAGYDLGSRTFPRERGSLSLFLSAPITPWRHALVRASALGVPAGLLAAAASLAASVIARLPVSQWPASVAVTIALAIMAVTGGMAVGIRFGNPDWRFPAEMLDRRGQMVSVGLFLLFVLYVTFARQIAAIPTKTLAIPAVFVATGMGVAFGILMLRITANVLARFESLNVRGGPTGE